jgi:hypothetical protein
VSAWQSGSLATQGPNKHKVTQIEHRRRRQAQQQTRAQLARATSRARHSEHDEKGLAPGELTNSSSPATRGLALPQPRLLMRRPSLLQTPHRDEQRRKRPASSEAPKDPPVVKGASREE